MGGKEQRTQEGTTGTQHLEVRQEMDQQRRPEGAASKVGGGPGG